MQVTGTDFLGGLRSSGRSPGRAAPPGPGAGELPAGKAPGAPGTQLIPPASPESLQAAHQHPFHRPAASTRREPFNAVLCGLSFDF